MQILLKEQQGFFVEFLHVYNHLLDHEMDNVQCALSNKTGRTNGVK